MINPTNETGYNPTNTSMLSSVYRASREVTAQLVEQRTENPRVTGSIPVLGTLVSYQWGISSVGRALDF